MKLFILLIALSVACGESAESEIEVPTQTTFGGQRPTELRVPLGYDGSQSHPLIIVLHGYSVNGLAQLAYTRFNDLVDDEEVFVMAPDGLIDDSGKHFWNATAACCDFFGTEVDDSTYLRTLIEEVSGVYNIDAKRIFLWGHSNGGFMAYRMACDHADLIAGIVSLAGATSLDRAQCNPSEPVSILQIHGDADTTIGIDGGETCVGCTFPGVQSAMSQWASTNGCSQTRTTDVQRLNVDANLSGDDTRVEHAEDCPQSIDVDLWVIEGGSHIPVVRSAFGQQMWDWFVAHAKP